MASPRRVAAAPMTPMAAAIQKVSGNPVVTEPTIRAVASWLPKAPPVTSTSLPFAEAAIAAFLEAGLDEAAAAHAYRATWHLLIGQIVNDHPLGHPGFTVDPAIYPALTATRPHLSHLDFVAEFEWSLNQLLNGILGPE
ncbi:hypothetical protein ACFYXQ_10660 [Nocardia jiangxiensis]|uniref:Tetracyclin repressor, C-terminal all-alpha domain n=1 Tax=Nocardia jiangxiensis TaxID=282685 RepID=A0ABW6RZ52_9NOCA